MFKQVIAVDNLAERHIKSQNLNKDRNNITYKVMDVYKEKWNFNNVGVVLIDCFHDYKHVKKDINNALQLGKNIIFLFDDYGLFPEVKRAIDEFIMEGKLKLIKKIGHYKGAIYPKTQNKILKDREGIICLFKFSN